MPRLSRLLLVLVVLFGVAACAGGGPGGSSRGGCYEQAPAGSQGYDTRPMFFLFCRQSP